MSKYFILIFSLGLSIFCCAQDLVTSPVSLTNLSTSHYKCLNGPVEIVGFDSSIIKVYGHCYKKPQIVFFSRNTFNYLKDSIPQGGGSFVSYKDLEYLVDSARPSVMYSQLALFGKGFEIYTFRDSIVGSGGLSYCMEFGFRSFGPNYSVYYANNGQFDYGYTPAFNQFFGIAITALRPNGSIVWSKIFPRSIMTASNILPQYGAPMIIQKNGCIYLFYVDRASNYDAQKIVDIHFGGALAAWKAKWDLVCLKISPVDGTYQKYLLSRKKDTKGMFFLNQTLNLEDGTFAILGQAKSYHTYMFYRLKIE
jgi:hypothetical protein